MGDNDLVEQSGECVEDADVDSVAEQQQDVAPVFEQPAQGANKFTWAFVLTVVAATGLGSARWSRRLCLENYTKIATGLKVGSSAATDKCGVLIQIDLHTNRNTKRMVVNMATP
jgi:hypothetical protein